DEVAVGVLVAVEDDGFLVGDRRATEAVTRQQLARRLAPDFLAVHVVADDLDVGVRKKRDPDVLAVGGGGGAGEAVLAVLLFELRGEDAAFPLHLAVCAIDAVEHAFLVGGDTGGDEYAITPDDGRGVADAGDGRLPGDVACAPADGDVLLSRGA